jgi:glutamine amidotransferase
MIVIIDYGVGNLGSIQNMLKKIGAPSKISNDPVEIERAGKLILPGIGAFDEGMSRLRATGLIPLLNHHVIEEQTPVLGICLGMQLLTRCSEEGAAKEPGLGWIQADTRRFNIPAEKNMRIPNMGWNFVDFDRRHPLAYDMPEDARFYFVHSYHPICDDLDNQFITAIYGYPFAAGIHRANIFGVQFHPEKSHKFGMKLLRNFVEQV